MRKIISLTLASAMVAAMGVNAFAAISANDTAVFGDGTKEPVQGAKVVTVSDPTTFSITLKNGTPIVAQDAKTPAEAIISVYSQLSAEDKENIDAYTTADAPGTIYYKADGNYMVFNEKAADQLVVNGAEMAARNWQTDWTEVVSPLAFAEPGDWNDKDGVKPGKSIYFLLQGDFNEYFENFKFTVSKGENAKRIKKVSVVEKRFGDGLKTRDSNKVILVGKRAAAVKVDLAEDMTDAEYKISFDLKVKADETFHSTLTDMDYEKGQTSQKWEEIGATWVYNTPVSGQDDLEYLAGTGGIMVKPVKNEENTVLWTDQNRDLAKLTFTADSDVAKYFPKLSTKWPNATYAQLFDDQDAFVFDFVGNPAISSTSRAVLELYCPYIDDEDEYTIDPESVVIYQVADDATLAASTEVELAKAILDGRLIDVTDKFTAGENEDGDFVYTTKTRTLGTYIIAEKAPSEEAFDEAEGEANDEKPADETGKTNPGTGR